MQEKNFTHEPLINKFSTSNRHISPTSAVPSAPPVVCLLIPRSEASGAATFLRRVLGIPGAAYLVMETGYEDNKGPDLASVVQQNTIMPVLVPEMGAQIEVDQVYLISPGMSFQYAGDKLIFRVELAHARGDGAVDLFLAAMAAATPDRHIVLLSQSLTDRLRGGLGVVRAEGGFVLAFSADDSLPYHQPGQTGISIADFILSPGEIVLKLHILLERIRKDKKLQIDGEGQEAELARIYLQLLHGRGMDFARRRQSDILRRIHRRMMIHNVDTLKEYLDALTEEAEEIALFEELRTSLTGFYLDPTVEHALLNDVLPELLRHHQHPSPLRIWIPCCCEGHEAYATAIFISDYLREQKKELSVQIFATDLNKAAGERSRIAVYDPAEMAGLSSRKRNQYFIKVPGGYQVTRSIREMCVFATQNLFKDPPFSRVDIILGFSAMRGLDATALENVSKIFHYALKPGAFLLADHTTSKDLSPDMFRRIRNNPGVFAGKEITAATGSLYPVNTIRLSEKEADNFLLSGYVPPTLLIDDKLRVVRFYGNTEPYLRFSQDRLSLHLLRMVRDELVFELNELLERSAKENGPVTNSGIMIGSGTSARQVSVEIAPIPPYGSKWKLVIIREMLHAPGQPGQPGSPALSNGQRSSGRSLNAKDQRILALEKEAGELRSLLLAANEDAARAQEGLQITNEEMMTSNEELQSVNEQLQSVNQQLLSFNLELNTVNEDLSIRNRELETSVEYAHAIVNSVRRPLVVLQDDLRIRLANQPFCHFFGVCDGDVLGQSLYTVANGLLDRDELHKALRQMLAKRFVSIDLELRAELADKGERILAIGITRMPRLKNLRPGLVLSIEDITERRATEKFKDEFIGIASHELKTPATSIQAYSQLLYEELAGGHDRQPAELAMKLSSQVSRLTRLTKDLLDVTRMTQGQANLKKDRLDMLQLIIETVEELQVTTSIRLIVAEHPPLPLIRGDRDRLRQVLVNLVSNAIKYAPHCREIIIRPGVVTDAITIAIQDFGDGISMESMRRIFDRYYRSEDASPGGNPGVGLGLYISSEIVRHHGGDIKVNSEKGKGTIFIITLPKE